MRPMQYPCEYRGGPRYDRMRRTVHATLDCLDVLNNPPAAADAAAAGAARAAVARDWAAVVCSQACVRTPGRAACAASLQATPRPAVAHVLEPCLPQWAEASKECIYRWERELASVHGIVADAAGASPSLPSLPPALPNSLPKSLPPIPPSRPP